MNTDQLKGKWQEMKGKVKEQWGYLTDDDITQINGNREKLEGRLRERYGYDKDRAAEEYERWHKQQSW